MKEFYLPGKEKIYYRKNDFDPKRKNVIFIHGFCGSSSVWIPYEKKFENKYNLLSIDLRGHGESFHPKDLNDYSIEKLSSDLYSIIKKEKLSNVILVAYSSGGLIAIDFIKEHKNIVKSMILISADAAPKKDLTKVIVPFISICPIINYFPQLKKNSRHVDYSKYIHTPEFNLKRMAEEVINIGLRSYLFSLKQLYDFDIEYFLPSIKAPVLILHGKKDNTFSVEASIRMNKLIKNSKLIIYKDYDHVILNNFENISSTFQKFITKC
ncbi:2-succinyl-6-hydroxy-2,4-cyclohexadiene-1-carboxylate synthase [uncultured archaeon]|nr:2-succinyl-6-hydroxy-2,4-cyclohexadiene-1-carboxylate synthase [uncultured archaeon]